MRLFKSYLAVSSLAMLMAIAGCSGGSSSGAGNSGQAGPCKLDNSAVDNCTLQ